MVSPISFFNSDYFTQFYNEHLKSKKGGGCDGLTPRTFWKRYQRLHIKTTPKDKLYTLLPEFWEDNDEQ